MSDLERRNVLAQLAGESGSIEYRAVYALSAKSLDAAACSLLPALVRALYDAPPEIAAGFRSWVGTWAEFMTEVDTALEHDVVNDDTSVCKWIVDAARKLEIGS